MFLFVFEFLGTTELLVLLAAALVLFGPRKLPEIGRTLGKSLAEFRRATEDFKRTWEREVEVDKLEREMRIEEAIHAPIAPQLPEGRDDERVDEGAMPAADGVSTEDQTIARRAPPPHPAVNERSTETSAARASGDTSARATTSDEAAEESPGGQK